MLDADLSQAEIDRTLTTNTEYHTDKGLCQAGVTLFLFRILRWMDGITNSQDDVAFRVGRAQGTAPTIHLFIYSGGQGHRPYDCRCFILPIRVYLRLSASSAEAFCLL